MNLRLLLFILLGIVVYIQLALFNNRMLARIDAAEPKAPPCREELHSAGAAALATTMPLQPPVETVAGLKEQLAHKEEQITTLQEAFLAIEARVQAFEEEAARGEKDQEIARLTDELGMRSRLLVEAQEGISARNQQMEELRATIADLQMQAEGLQVEKEELMGDLGRLQGTLQDATEKQTEGQALQLQLQQQLSDRDQRLQKLEEQVEELNALLATSRENNETFQQQLQTLQDGGAEKEARLAQLQKENQQLTAHLAEVRDQLAVSQEQVQVHARLGEQLKETQETLTGVESQLVERRNAFEQLSDQYQDLQQQLQAAQAARQEAEGTAEKLEQEVARHPQVVAELEQKLDERRSGLEEKEAQVSQLQAKTEELENQITAAQERIAELEPWQGKSGDLEKELELSREKEQALQSQLGESREELGTLQARVQEQQRNLDNFADERIGLTSKIQTLQGYSKDYLNMKAALEAKTASLAEAEQRIEGLNALQTQVQELQAKNKELDDLVASKETALAKQAAVKADLAKVHEELQAVQKSAQDLNTRNVEQTEFIAALEKEKATLEANLAAVPDIDALKKQIQDGLERQQDLERQIATQKEALAQQEELQALVERSQAETKQAQEKCGAIRTEKQKLQESLDTSQVQLTELRGQIGILEKTLAENEAKVPDTSRYEEQISALQADKETLQKSLSEGQDMVRSLEEQVQGLQRELEAEKLKAREAMEPMERGPAEPEATPPQPPQTSEAEAQPDGDGDGVPDSMDLCPDSEAGAAVNAMGCAPRVGIVLEGVVFPTGSNELTADARQRLDRVAATLAQQDQLKAEVAGYTDSRGNAEANRRLSQRRAEAVMAYLVEKGIAADRLSARGYGQDNPIASNNNEAGRQRNRRVELHPEGM